MKREHWFLIAGLCIGLILGGIKCSFSVTQTPTALGVSACGKGVAGE